MSKLINQIMRDEKAIILAMDQGFEHGPVDFNEENIHPRYVMDIALKEEFTAFACQIGVARHYYTKKYRGVPLLIKLNGKTRFDNEDPVSLQHTTVEHAASIGAKAVGYTIYLGSTHEQEMFIEFGRICEEAHNRGLAAVCWMYPRGPHIKDETDTKTLAYGARIAMELGADMVKTKSNGDLGGMKWVVKSAGAAKTVFAGGSLKDDLQFLKNAEFALKTGGVGLAVGRNIWQSKHPYLMSEALKQVIFEGVSPDKALKNVKLE